LKLEEPEYSLEKYFDYYHTEEGQKKAKCRICKAELSRASNSSMGGHLLGPHKEFFKLYDAARRKFGLHLQHTRPSQGASSGYQ
jgi:hypothetical protein